MPAGWSVWQEHDGRYVQLTDADVRAGASGRLILRWEGTDAARPGQLSAADAAAASPAFELGFAGAVPEDESVTVSYGFELHSYTAPLTEEQAAAAEKDPAAPEAQPTVTVGKALRKASGAVTLTNADSKATAPLTEEQAAAAEKDPAAPEAQPTVTVGKALRKASGAVTLTNADSKAKAELTVATLGTPEMPQAGGAGAGWWHALATFAVPRDVVAASTVGLSAQWRADWQGKNGIPTSSLARFRVAKDDEEAEDGRIDQLALAAAAGGEVDVTAETLADNTYIGVPGQGGAVVLDVADLTDAQIASIDAADPATIEALGLEPIAYELSADGTVRVLRDRSAGRVEPGSQRKLLVAAPFDEAALTDAPLPEGAPADATPDYAPVTATFGMQAGSVDNGEPVYLTEAADLAATFKRVDAPEAPAVPDDEPSADDPDADEPGADDEPAAPAEPDENGVIPPSGPAIDLPDGPSIPMAGTPENLLGVGGSFTIMRAPLRAAAPRAAAIDWNNIMDPYATLLTENEALPGTVNTWLIKGTSEITRINLTADFAFSLGYLGDQQNKTKFTVNIPYLYFDDKNAVWPAYTYEEYQAAIKKYYAYNVNNAMSLRLVPDTSFFTQWDVKDDRNRSITATSYNAYYKDGLVGSFTFSYKGLNARGEMDPNFKRPEFQVQFIGTIPENTGATIMVGGDATLFNDMVTKHTGNFHRDPGKMEAGDIHNRTMTFIKTNLQWHTTVTNMWSPAMWDRFNYMVYRVETVNTSEEKDTLIDYLGHSFLFPGDQNGGGGMRQEDVMAFWAEDGSKVAPGISSNPSAVGPNGNSALIGKPGEGGVLIYDVTQVDDVIWNSVDNGGLDLDKFSNIQDFLDLTDATSGKPLVRQLEYMTGGQPSRVTFRIGEGEGGTLIPQTDDDRVVILLALPYTNNFTPFTMNGVKVYPNVSLDTTTTVYFGGRGSDDYSWAKTLYNSDSFKEAKNGFEYTKTAWNRLGRNWTGDARDRLGYSTRYRISGITTTGNMPVSANDLTLPYGPVINDTMPSNYEMLSIEFRMKREHQVAGNPIPYDLSDYVYTGSGATPDPANAVQFEVRTGADRPGSAAPRQWVTLTGSPQYVGPDPENPAYDIYRVGGTTTNDGIAALLEARGIAAKPRNSTVTGTATSMAFTGKMRFLMAQELPKGTALPVDITINGIMRSPVSNGADGRYTNTIDAEFGRKQWVVPTQKYDTAKYYGATSQASLLPESGVRPWVGGAAFDLPTGAATPNYSAWDGTENAPLNESRSGYVFHLGNASTSMIEPGKFVTTDMRIGDKRFTGAYSGRNGIYEYRGFDTSSIELNAALWAKSNISGVRVWYKSPNHTFGTSGADTQSTWFSRQDIISHYLRSDGSVAIPKSAWSGTGWNNYYFLRLEITFDTFNSDVANASSPGAAGSPAVILRGTTSYTGQYKVTGTFSTSYSLGGATVQSQGSGTLNVNPAQPRVYANAWEDSIGWSGWNAERPSALLRNRSGFAFHWGNYSPTVLEPGRFLTSAMPYEMHDGARRGFETDWVYLSKETFDCTNNTINEIIVTALDSDNNEVTYTWKKGDGVDQITPLKAADGSVRLTPADWGKNYFSRIEVRFDEMKANVSAAPTGYGTGPRVQIHGMTTWLANQLRVQGELRSWYTYLDDDGVEQVDDTMNVSSIGKDVNGNWINGYPCTSILAPYNASPVVDAYAFDVKKSSKFSGNGGTQSAPLNSKRSGWYFRLRNTSDSYVDPGIFSTSNMTYQVIDGDKRGFETSSVTLTRGLLAKGTIDKVRLYYSDAALADSYIEIPWDASAGAPDNLQNYLVAAGSAEATQYGADAVGSIVLPASVWNNEYFARVEVYFDRYSPNVTATSTGSPDDTAVIVYGAPSQMGTRPLSGTFRTVHLGNQSDNDTKDKSATYTASLTANTINPQLAMSAGWSLDGAGHDSGVYNNVDRNGKDVRSNVVPYRWGENPAREKAWFQYQLTNNTECSGDEVYLNLNINEISADTDKNRGEFRGFVGRELVIAGFSQNAKGEWVHTSGTLHGIDVYDYTNAKVMSLTMADLVPFISGGTLTLPFKVKDPTTGDVVNVGVKTVQLRYKTLNEWVVGANTMTATIYGMMETHGAAMNNANGYWTGSGSSRHYVPPDPMYQYRYTTGACSFGPLDRRYNDANGNHTIGRSTSWRSYIGWFDWWSDAWAYRDAYTAPGHTSPLMNAATGDPVEVVHNADGSGYHFRVKNNTLSRSDYNALTFDLTSVSNKLSVANPGEVYGFLTKEVTLNAAVGESGHYWDELPNAAGTSRQGESTLKTVNFFFADSVTGAAPATPDVKLTLADLQKYKQPNGSYKIPVHTDATQTAGAEFTAHATKYLRKVTVSYDVLDPSYFNKLMEVDFKGQTTWYSNYNTTVHMDGVIGAAQTGTGFPGGNYVARATRQDPSLLTGRPALDVTTHGRYVDMGEGAYSSSATSDGNITRISAPYDRDLLLWAQFENSHAYNTIDGADVDLYLGLYRESGIVTPPGSSPTVAPTTAWTGFHTTKMTITAQYLEQWGTPGKIQLTGARSSEGAASLKATLEAQVDATTGDLLGFKSGSTTFPLEADGSFVLTEKQIIDLGIDELTFVKLLDWREMERRTYQASGGANVQRIYFEGFSDRNLGETINGIDARTTVYLNNIRQNAQVDDNYYYQVKRNDRTEIRMSKMFFDANTRVAYNDESNENRAYQQWSYAFDEDHDYWNSYWGWGGTEIDQQLELGYKALGSYTLDFRQLRGTNGIEKACHYDQWCRDHGQYAGSNYWCSEGRAGNHVSTIDGRTYNTAAVLDFEQTIPSDAFDAYYVRVRDAAVPYLNSITVYYADGSSFVVDKAAIQAHRHNARGTGTDGQKYFRLNLLAKDASGKHVADFDTNDETKFFKDAYSGYWNSSDPAANDRVTKIVYNVSINQNQYTDANKNVANQVDFGTWYQWNNPNYDAFEVTGRFFKVKGEIYSTTNVKMRIGNTQAADASGNGNSATRPYHKAQVRYDSGDRNATQNYRSNWSYQDYVPSGHHGHVPYKMRHLWTRARAVVVEAGAYTRKGHWSSLENGRDGIAGGVRPNAVRFGSDQYFSVSFQRHYGSAQYNQWSNKLSFTDEAVLRDVMPVCRPDAEMDYYGFLSTGMQILGRDKANYENILPHVKEIIFRLEQYDAAGAVIGTRSVTVSRADLGVDAAVAANKGVYIYFDRPKAGNIKEDVPEKSGGKTDDFGQAVDSGNCYKLSLGAEEFVDSYDIVLQNFGGAGDHSQEVGRKHGAQANMDRTNADVRVYGRPYAYVNQTPTVNSDANNTSQTFTRRYGTELGAGKQEYWHGTDGLNTSNTSDDFVNTDNAFLLGYLIPYGYNFSIQRRGNNSSQGSMPYFAASDNLSPAYDSFEARFWNIKDRWPSDPDPDNDGRVSHINQVTLRATTSGDFRLQKVYVPKELVPTDASCAKDADGNPLWLAVRKFTFVYNGKTIAVDWPTLQGMGIVSAAPLSSGTYANCYEVDLEKYLREQFNLWYASNGADGIRPVTYTAVQKTNLIPGYAADLTTVNRTYINSRISDLYIDYYSPTAHRKTPQTMLDSGQYLSGNRTTNASDPYNYAFAYDGVYVDRTLDDFLTAQETTYANLATGNWNEFATPTGNKQGMAYPDINCRETLTVASTQTRDPNHCAVNDRTYVQSGNDGFHHDPYADNILWHRLAQLETSSVRGKQVTLNGATTTIFGYDNSNNDIESPVSYSPESAAKGANIPDGGLYAGDYVEYVVRVGNKPASAGSKYDVPLESVDARFQVEAGQRIVGWEVQKVKQADGTWVADNTTGLPVTAEIGDTSLAALRDAPQQVDLSLLNGVESYAQNRVLMIKLGRDKWEKQPLLDADNNPVLNDQGQPMFTDKMTEQADRQVAPGEYVAIRIITQLTGERGTDVYHESENNTGRFNNAGDVPSYRDVALRADFYAASAPMHGYLQYIVPGGGDNNHDVWGYSNDTGLRTISNGANAWYTTAHQRGLYTTDGVHSQFGSRVYNYVRFYNHRADRPRGGADRYNDPTITMAYTGQDPATLLHSRPRADGDTAQLTIQNIMNPTYHTTDLTVTVSLLDQYGSGRQVFELTDTPKLANGTNAVQRITAAGPDQGKMINLRYPTNIPPSLNLLSRDSVLNDVVSSIGTAGGGIGGGSVDVPPSTVPTYQVSYLAGSGGTVDPDVDPGTDASMAGKLPANSAYAEGDIKGAKAEAKPGYAFEGWYKRVKNDDGTFTDTKIEGALPELTAALIAANLNTKAAVDTEKPAQPGPGAGSGDSSGDAGSGDSGSDSGDAGSGDASGGDSGSSDGGSSGGTTPPSTGSATIYDDTTFVAKFVPDDKRKYSVTYEVSDKDQGAITNEGDIAMQALGTDRVTGSTASAKDGFIFDGWYVRTRGDSGEVVDVLVTEGLQLTAAEVIEVLDERFVNDEGLYTDATFVAKFVDESQRKFTVAYAASGEGQVRTAGYTVGEGDSATTVQPGEWGKSAANLKVPRDGSAITGANAQPAEGYQCDGWFLVTTAEDGSTTEEEVTTDPTLTRETITGLFTEEEKGCQLEADVTFVAKFSPKTTQRYTVTYASDGNGEVRTLGTPGEDGEEQGAGSWGASATNAGIVALITDGVTGAKAQGKPGYAFDGWYVNLKAADGTVTETRIGTDPELSAALAAKSLNKIGWVEHITRQEEQVIYDEVTRPKTEEVSNPKMVQSTEPKVDDNGDPVLDDEGNQVMEPVFDDEGNPVMEPVLDDEGNPVMEIIQVPVLDDEGNPVMETVKIPQLNEDGTEKTHIVTVVDDVEHPGETVYVDTTFTAKFKPNPALTYTVAYNPTTGGSVSTTANTDQQLSTAKVTGSTAAAKPGYEFVGWFLRVFDEPAAARAARAARADGDAPTYTDTKISENTTLIADEVRAVLAKDADGLYEDTVLIAKFQPEGSRTYTVTYLADENGDVETAANANLQVLSTDGVTGSVALPGTGYKFAGWFVRTYVEEQQKAQEPVMEEKYETVQVPVLDEDGYQMYDDFGNPITKPETHLVVDEDGNPVLQPVMVPVLDNEGNPVKDENGDPVTEPKMQDKKDENGNQVYETVRVPHDEPIPGARASLTKDLVVAQLEKGKDANGLYTDLTLVCKFAEKGASDPDEDLDPYTVTYTAVDGTVDTTVNGPLDATSTVDVTGSTATPNAGFEFVGWFVRTTEYVPDANGVIQAQQVDKKIDGAGLTLTAWEAQSWIQKDDTGLCIDTLFIAKFQKKAVKEDLSKESVSQPETLGDRDPILIEYWDTRAIKNADGTYSGKWITIDELDALAKQPDRVPTVADEGYYKILQQVPLRHPGALDLLRPARHHVQRRHDAVSSGRRGPGGRRPLSGPPQRLRRALRVVDGPEDPRRPGLHPSPCREDPAGLLPRDLSRPGRRPHPDRPCHRPLPEDGGGRGQERAPDQAGQRQGHRLHGVPPHARHPVPEPGVPDRGPGQRHGRQELERRPEDRLHPRGEVLVQGHPVERAAQHQLLHGRGRRAVQPRLLRAHTARLPEDGRRQGDRRRLPGQPPADQHPLVRHLRV